MMNSDELNADVSVEKFLCLTIYFLGIQTLEDSGESDDKVEK